MQTETQHSKTKSTAENSPRLKTENERIIETSGRSNNHHEEITDQEMKLTILSERVLHLKCLLDFIQTEPDLQRLLSLRAQVAAGSLETISFPDIWLLVRPGDLIVSRFTGHWQLLKVYATTGGQIQRTARDRHFHMSHSDRSGKSARAGGTITVEEDETEKLLREADYGIGSWTPLKVDCYYLGFVGDELRPIDELHKIKHFHGDMKITELPIYPARFQPDAADFLKRIEDRGLKFLMSPGHKSYKGPSARLTPTDSAREIDGDVYVDNSRSEEDYQRGRVRFSLDAGPGLVKSRAEVTESEEVVGDKILRLTGNETDNKRSEEFMAENRFKLDSVTVEKAKGSIDYLRLLPWVVQAYVFRLRLWGKSNQTFRTKNLPSKDGSRDIF